MKRQTIERKDKPTSRNEWKLRYTIDKGFAETYLKYQYDMENRNLIGFIAKIIGWYAIKLIKTQSILENF